MNSNFIYRRFGYILITTFLFGVAAAKSQQTPEARFDPVQGPKQPIFQIPCSEIGNCKPYQVKILSEQQ